MIYDLVLDRVGAYISVDLMTEKARKFADHVLPGNDTKTIYTKDSVFKGFLEEARKFGVSMTNRGE